MSEEKHAAVKYVTFVKKRILFFSGNLKTIPFNGSCLSYSSKIIDNSIKSLPQTLIF